MTAERPRWIADPTLRIPFRGGVLRPWRRSDAGALVRNADDREVWRNLGDAFPHPYTPRDAKTWLEGGYKTRNELSLAIDLGEGAVGGFGLQFRTDPIFRGTAELGYWLGRAWWGRGIMTEVVRAFVPWAFERFDLIRVEAGVLAWNPASARVLERAGFAFESRQAKYVIKDGQVLDRLLYVRFRE